MGLHLKSDALHSLAGRVGAFGDFDSDQYTDIFWIDDEAHQVSVQRWNHKTDSFEAAPAASAQVPGSCRISVVPSDFNFDGRMDLLVVCTDSTSGESELFLYFGGRGAVNGVSKAGEMGASKVETNERKQPTTIPILSDRPLVLGRAMGQVQECSSW